MRKKKALNIFLLFNSSFMYIFLTNIWKLVVPFIHEVWSTVIFIPGTIIYSYVYTIWSIAFGDGGRFIE